MPVCTLLLLLSTCTTMRLYRGVLTLGVPPPFLSTSCSALGQLGMSPDTTTGSVDTSSLGADATPGSYGVDTEPSPSPRPTPTRMPAPTTAVISQTPSAVASPPPKSSGSTAAVSVAAVVVGGLAVLAL
jgi:hypothetical protein